MNRADIADPRIGKKVPFLHTFWGMMALALMYLIAFHIDVHVFKLGYLDQCKWLQTYASDQFEL